jgi:hypothetical protein
MASIVGAGSTIDPNRRRPAAVAWAVSVLEASPERCRTPGKKEGSLMKRVATVIAAVTLATALATGTAAAAAPTPASLSAAGWTCFNVPGLGVHCLAPGDSFAGPTVQLLYFFGTTDPTDAEAAFTGTETLIRADLYRGQPCPTEGGGPYTFLADLGYYACHHL